MTTHLISEPRFAGARSQLLEIHDDPISVFTHTETAPGVGLLSQYGIAHGRLELVAQWADFPTNTRVGHANGTAVAVCAIASKNYTFHPLAKVEVVKLEPTRSSSYSQLPNLARLVGEHNVTSMAWSSNGDIVVSTSTNQNGFVWSWPTGEVAQLESTPGFSSHFIEALTPAKSWFAVSHEYGYLEMYERQLSRKLLLPVVVELREPNDSRIQPLDGELSMQGDFVAMVGRQVSNGGDERIHVIGCELDTEKLRNLQCSEDPYWMIPPSRDREAAFIREIQRPHEDALRIFPIEFSRLKIAGKEFAAANILSAAVNAESRKFALQFASESAIRLGNWRDENWTTVASSSPGQHINLRFSRTGALLAGFSERNLVLWDLTDR